MKRNEALELLISQTNENGVVDGMSIDSIIDGKYKDIFKACEILDLSITANGSLYKKDSRGFLATLMKEIFDHRTIYKKEMIEAQKQLEKSPNNPELKTAIASLKAKQQAYKILANSGYGALANEHFTFFSNDLAMSITMSGQLTIKWVAKYLNDFMNKAMQTVDKDYIISIDTDSNYVHCGPLVEKYCKGFSRQETTNFLDAFAEKKLQPIIDKAFAELAVTLNAFDPCMKMKREAIAEKGLWSGKKRYVLNVLDNEGVRFDNPKMKFTGLEVVRSSIPGVCRDALKEAMNIIMTKTEDDLIAFVDDFKTKYRKMDFYDIAFPRGMNGLNEYYDPVHLCKPKCPIHVRGAIVYNEWLKEHKLTGKYPLINDGEKIKFCYMKLPNNLRSNVISISTKMPDELNIGTMIDYTTQFEKSFEEPLKAILNIIHWSFEKRNSFGNMFAKRC